MKPAREEDEASPPEFDTISLAEYRQRTDELDQFAAAEEYGAVSSAHTGATTPPTNGWPVRALLRRGAARARHGTALYVWLVAALAAGVGFAASLRYQPRATTTATGEISVDSLPPGAQVKVEGVVKGVTPVVLALPEGNHLLELSFGDTRRERTVAIRAGTTASHFVEFLPSAPELAAGPTTGQLQITSDRAGAPVLVDGTRRGVTPLMLTDVPAGPHRVTVGEGAGAIERVVNVAPNSQVSVVATRIGESASAGWVAIAAPFEMQIAEGQTILGTTSASRTMLPAGRHELRLKSDALNFQTSLVVNIPPGGSVSAAVEVPQSTLSVNAVPWAEVAIDGRPVGPTPIGSLAMPIGTHEVVWRHPTYGERRQAVTVKAGTPSRVGVDFTTP